MKTALNQHYLSKFISKKEGTKKIKMDNKKAIVKHKMQNKINISPSKIQRLLYENHKLTSAISSSPTTPNGTIVAPNRAAILTNSC